MKLAAKWMLWVLVAGALVMTVYMSGLLILAFRESMLLEDIILLAIPAGIAVNLLFAETRLLYLTALALPLLSAIILPEVWPTILAAGVAAVWALLSRTLGAVRSRI